MTTKKHLTTALVASANKLALNLVHCIESNVGYEFLWDALQEYETSRAIWTGMGTGYHYSDRLHETLMGIQKARQHAPAMLDFVALVAAGNTEQADLERIAKGILAKVEGRKS